MTSVAKEAYRADIDGLRAIAVLAVVFFHVNSAIVPGGFVGVDVFFVISGFLITKIIFREISAGEFKFSAFYARRIRRILPVFFVVLAATMTVGIVLLLPADLKSLISSIRYALFFCANIFFSRDGGYFDISADEKPLLHIWSLSVEEQYYFIWPLLLLLLCFFVRKVSAEPRGDGREKLLLVTAVLLAASIGISQYSLKHPILGTNSYFLLHARFGELLIGSVTAFLPVMSGFERRGFPWVIGCMGMLSVIASIFLLDGHDPFPGVNALFPCLGAAMIIYSGQYGSSQRGVVYRLLSHSVVVYIGLLSFSIYMWHWPILAFMRYVYGYYGLPLAWSISALLLTFGLSLASYYLVERRVKVAALTFNRAFCFVYVLPCSFLLASVYFSANATKAEQVRDDLANYGTDICHSSLDKSCVRGQSGKEPTVLMIGDSHAAALNSFIDVVGKHENWSATVVSSSSCSPVFDFDEAVLPESSRAPCAALKKYVRENYKKYDAVFIASYWAFQLGWLDLPSDKNYLAKLTLTVAEMARDRPVYIFSDVPRLPVSPFRLAHFARLGLNVMRPLSQQNIEANSVIRRSLASIKNVHWVDLVDAESATSNYGTYQGLPAYFDNQHLNRFGSAALGEEFSKKRKLFDSEWRANLTPSNSREIN